MTSTFMVIWYIFFSFTDKQNTCGKKGKNYDIRKRDNCWSSFCWWLILWLDQFSFMASCLLCDRLTLFVLFFIVVFPFHGHYLKNIDLRGYFSCWWLKGQFNFWWLKGQVNFWWLKGQVTFWWLKGQITFWRLKRQFIF